VVKALSLGALTEYEKKLLEQAIPELEGNVKKGVEFIVPAGPKL
jgi:hypothetical protein